MESCRRRQKIGKGNVIGLYLAFIWLITIYRCIQGLVRFAQPILDLISEATSWKTTLLAGGPEPAHEGRLNVIRYL